MTTKQQCEDCKNLPEGEVKKGHDHRPHCRSCGVRSGEEHAVNCGDEFCRMIDCSHVCTSRCGNDKECPCQSDHYCKNSSDLPEQRKEFDRIVKTTRDGDMWCCLYPQDSNLQDGTAFFHKARSAAEREMFNHLVFMGILKLDCPNDHSDPTRPLTCSLCDPTRSALEAQEQKEQSWVATAEKYMPEITDEQREFVVRMSRCKKYGEVSFPQKECGCMLCRFIDLQKIKNG